MRGATLHAARWTLPAAQVRRAGHGTLAGDGTAVSMEPTLADDDPVGLVPMADVVKPVGAAD